MGYFNFWRLIFRHVVSLRLGETSGGTSGELHASEGKSFAQPSIAAEDALALLVGADLGVALGEGERPSGEGPLPRRGGLESPAEHALDS